MNSRQIKASRLSALDLAQLIVITLSSLEQRVLVCHTLCQNSS